MSSSNSSNKPQIMFQFESILSFPPTSSNAPHVVVGSQTISSPIQSPSSAPKIDEKKVHSHSDSHSEGKVHLAEHDPHDYHSFDKSIAGACVILGGLATTFLVAVFCYVRATRSHKQYTNDYA
ncbi:hypothetical protein PIB30_018527 [Stylosanthes scabra]|uniref:Transmembrane protein n=1 Tax=Stylosanthes scabra TaxID=79078 RepID=A0ABU6Y591_9FABA|nr:hypothetical protein [Stylosanthes scabra]